MNKTTIDEVEVAKFAQHATQWWDPEGPLKTLHDINPARLTFIEHTQSLSGLRVLDIGCGGGVLSEAMAMKGALVTGLDVEDAAIIAARKHSMESKLKIDYICQALEEYVAEPFAVITCMEMLEHVQEPQLIIEHAARLLKPGGYLFLSTINRNLKSYASVVIAAEYLLNLLPRQTHDYDKFIKPSELATMIRSNGLDIVEIKGMGYNPLTRQASLKDSVAINYLMACRKIDTHST